MSPRRQPPLALLLALATSWLAVLPVRAQLEDGDLDTSFWDDGKVVHLDSGNALVRAVVVAPDDRVVVAGQRVATGGTESFFWRAYGDSSFGPLCAVPPPGGATGGAAWDAAFDGTGRLVLVGSADYPSLGRVVGAMRFLYPECVLDPSFDGDGYWILDLGDPAEARAVAIAASGAIVLAGTLATGGEGDNFLIVRLLANGTLDSTFNGTGVRSFDFGNDRDDRSYDVAVQADGRIVVAGERQVSILDPLGWDFAAARLTFVGELDPSFAVDGLKTIPFDLGTTNGTRRDSANALAIDRLTGSILLAGSADHDTGRSGALARLTPGGALDSSFHSDGLYTFDVYAAEPFTRVAAVALQDDGKILIAATTRSGAQDDRWIVMRRQPDGSNDFEFGTLGDRFIQFDLGGDNDDRVGAVTLQAGKIVVAGQVENATGFKAGLARLWNAPVFSDGFESGWVGRWTATAGLP